MDEAPFLVFKYNIKITNGLDFMLQKKNGNLQLMIQVAAKKSNYNFTPISSHHIHDHYSAALQFPSFFFNPPFLLGLVC